MYAIMQLYKVYILYSDIPFKGAIFTYMTHFPHCINSNNLSLYIYAYSIYDTAKAELGVEASKQIQSTPQNNNAAEAQAAAAAPEGTTNYYYY